MFTLMIITLTKMLLLLLELSVTVHYLFSFFSFSFFFPPFPPWFCVLYIDYFCYSYLISILFETCNSKIKHESSALFLFFFFCICEFIFLGNE